MQYMQKGRIVKVTGGLYTVALEAGETPLAGQMVECRARGTFRHERTKPLVGDGVVVEYTDASVRADAHGRYVPCPDRTGLVMAELLPRRNALIRPPLANLDMVLVVAAAAAPAPDMATMDKLMCILEFHQIQPVVVVSKAELSPERAAELKATYEMAGYPVFVLSSHTGEGMDQMRAFLHKELPGHLAAVAGASGVGKSTLLNHLFPELSLATGDISRRIERGKNTTRHTQLFALPDLPGGYVADTAGFSLLDFEHFDFFTLEDLPATFPEIQPCVGHCRYTDCTHLKEEGCAVLAAVREGRMAASRHKTYADLYAILKEKHRWNKK